MKTLAAKKISGLALAVAMASGQVQAAGIPTIDVANIVQTTTTAMESVKQTLQQIEQYQTQLQQYENQIKNTLAPAAYVWDQAQKTIGKIQNKMFELKRLKDQMGDTDNWLEKFQSVNTYRNSECFSLDNCTAGFIEYRMQASEMQKATSDDLTRGLDAQLSALEDDADTLTKLQQQAQGAEGQMQALGAANQLSSSIAAQLLQMRTLIVAQMNAANTASQVAQARQAQEDAAQMRAISSGGITGGDKKVQLPF